ncbi:MAG: amidohydrolase family protein [Deinococcales bacterium]
MAQKLKAHTPQHIIPTLLAHVVPKNWQRSDYLKVFCEELIPEVARQGLAEAVDVFCDRGAFNLEETRVIFEAAVGEGLRVKAHAEQLEPTHASQLVAHYGGLSADHLEQSDSDDWGAMARANTVATLLPGATFILKKHFPDVQAMRSQGLKIALASDFNPGSSPLMSLFLTMQLGMLAGLSLEESLIATTAHAADALGRSELGRLAVGCQADFLLVNHINPRYPLYTWGHSDLKEVYIAGKPCLHELLSR